VTFLQNEDSKKSGDMHITISDETIEAVIKFKIRGNLRFLSHAEMLKVFQRACVRAGIKLAYSEGFNPRPKLSLPLPRSVGIETDDDLLCVRVETSASSFDSKQFKDRLSSQLPEGCELLTVSKAKAPFRAGAATYVLPVHQKYINEKLKSRIERVLAMESLNLERRRGPNNSKFKNVDVSPFLKSIELDGRNIIVECKISPAGSIRVDEILELLELNCEMLTAPIRRTRVEWQEA
jgi:radical SAM-linked protein